MRINTLIMQLLVFLTFFDFLFFNLKTGPITLTLLRVVLFLLFSFLVVKQIDRRKIFAGKLLYINYMLLFLVIWVFYGVLQLTWAIDKPMAYKQIYYLVIYSILIYVTISLVNKENFAKVFNLIYYISIIFLLFSLIEIHFGIHLPISGLAHARRDNNVTKGATAVFYNVNDYSFYIVLTAGAYIVRIFRSSGYKKLMNSLLLVISFYIIYFNDAKLSLISLLMELVITFVLYGKRNIQFNGKRNKLTIFGILFLALITILLKGSYISNSYSLISNQLQHHYGSASTRLNLINEGLVNLVHSHFLGVGPGNFEANVYNIHLTDWIRNAHNWWVELLTNYGMFIFVIYIIGFVILLIKLNKMRKSSNDEVSFFAEVFLLGFIGFILASMEPSSIFYNTEQWLLFGLAFAFVNIYYQNE